MFVSFPSMSVSHRISVCFTFSGDTLLQPTDGPRVKDCADNVQCVFYEIWYSSSLFLVCLFCFCSVVHLLSCFLNVAEDLIIQKYQWYSVGPMHKLIHWSDKRLCYLWYCQYQNSEYTGQKKVVNTFFIAFECNKPPYDTSRVCMRCVWYNVFLTSLKSLHCSIWSLCRKQLIDLIGRCIMSWYDLRACGQGWIPS